jgi:ribosomal protein S18 acetylase RimI-like enzyme
MAGSRTDVNGFLYEWVTSVDAARMKQIRALFNAVLETETVIGFPGPLREEEGQAYFDGLAQDVQLQRKDLMLVQQGPERRAVGMVLLSQNSQPNCRHIAELSKCIIHPEFRGQGVLDDGLRALAAHCQQLGVDLLTMDVRKGSRAEKIWRQLGFTPFGELADYARVNGRSEAGIFMSAPISALGRKA